ncbi:hypothetical protein ACLOJK_014815 [Asimina triloba]
MPVDLLFRADMTPLDAAVRCHGRRSGCSSSDRRMKGASYEGRCWLAVRDRARSSMGEIEGSESSCCRRHFGRIGSGICTSRRSSPPAAMAAGLGEGDGAPYGCSSGAP